MKLLKKYWIVVIVIFACCMFYKPALGFLMIGSIALLMSVHYFLFLKDIGKNGLKCMGRILSYERDEEGYKTPIIEFETVDGKHIKQKPYYYASSDLSKIKSYKDSINTSVSILYDRENPEKFILESEKDFNYSSLILFIIVGIIFITLSGYSLLEYIKIDF